MSSTVTHVERRFSRLESAIRRLETQRFCIDFAARPGHLPHGPILAVGLGDGCAYDHLRTVFRSREIFVIDRRVDPGHDCRPEPQNLFLGEITETFSRIAPRFRGRVALVHLNFSSGSQAIDCATMATIAPLIELVTAPSALVVGDEALPLSEWQRVSLFELPRRRYFLYRKAPASLTLVAPSESAGRVRNAAGVPSYAAV